MKERHPIQPLEEDQNGTLRFKENPIVRFLLDDGPTDLNRLAIMQFSNEDREQFTQLIGYSLCGFGELDYTSDKTYDQAEAQYSKKKIQPKNSHYKEAENILKSVVETLNLIIENDREDISYYFSHALDEPIQDLMKAMRHMVIAEND